MNSVYLEWQFACADVEVLAVGCDCLEDVLDAVPAAQVAAEQRGEHISVGERGPGRAALAEGGVDGPAQAAAVKLFENGEKTPERVDVVGF